MAFCLTIAGCTAGNRVTQKSDTMSQVQPQFTAGPPTLVYKTKKDYSDKVPVLLSEDKKKIVSYPDPRDISTSNGYRPGPALLAEGYLLDNRGIGLHVAYLDMDYATYSKLEKAPSMAEMMSMIIDTDPLTELCNCGNRLAFSDPEKQLTELIRTGKLRTACKVIK